MPLLVVKDIDPSGLGARFGMEIYAAAKDSERRATRFIRSTFR